MDVVRKANPDRTIKNIILFTRVEIMYGMMCSILFIDEFTLQLFSRFVFSVFWSFTVALSKMLFPIENIS